GGSRRTGQRPRRRAKTAAESSPSATLRPAMEQGMARQNRAKRAGRMGRSIVMKSTNLGLARPSQEDHKATRIAQDQGGGGAGDAQRWAEPSRERGVGQAGQQLAGHGDAQSAEVAGGEERRGSAVNDHQGRSGGEQEHPAGLERILPAEKEDACG